MYSHLLHYPVRDLNSRKRTGEDATAASPARVQSTGAFCCVNGVENVSGRPQTIMGRVVKGRINVMDLTVLLNGKDSAAALLRSFREIVKYF